MSPAAEIPLSALLTRQRVAAVVHHGGKITHHPDTSDAELVRRRGFRPSVATWPSQPGHSLRIGAAVRAHL
jgi:hypothetical protein